MTVAHSIAFQGTEDFEALNRATAFLEAAGFSYGSLQRGCPMGVMHGDCSISKWSNLDRDERRLMHGTLNGPGGSFRIGPVRLDLYKHAPAEARAAIAKAEGK
jgi:hypothetical protein